MASTSASVALVFRGFFALGSTAAVFTGFSADFLRLVFSSFEAGATLCFSGAVLRERFVSATKAGVFFADTAAFEAGVFVAVLKVTFFFVEVALPVAVVLPIFFSIGLGVRAAALVVVFRVVLALVFVAVFFTGAVFLFVVLVAALVVFVAVAGVLAFGLGMAVFLAIGCFTPVFFAGADVVFVPFLAVDGFVVLSVLTAFAVLAVLVGRDEVFFAAALLREAVRVTVFRSVLVPAEERVVVRTVLVAFTFFFAMSYPASNIKRHRANAHA